MPAIAPAPPAPPPKPVLPPTPPAAVPHGTDAKPPKQEADDLSASLDAAFAPAPPKEPAKPAAKESDNGEAEKPPAKTPDAPAAKPKPTAENNFAAMRKKIEELEAERDGYKSKAEKPQPIEDHPEFKTQAQRLTDLQKQYEETEKELTISNYVKSKEYREKFKKPLDLEWADAYREVASLTYTAEDGSERQPTDEQAKEQFHLLMQLPKKQAIAKAKELWGDDMGPEIIKHRWTLEKLHRDANEAVQSFEKEGEEIERRRTADMVKEDDMLKKVWRNVNESAAEKFAAIFKTVDGDEDGSAMLTKSFKNIDGVLGPLIKSALAHGNPLVKSEKGLAEIAIIRHAFPALIVESKRRQALETKLAKAEADLAEFRKGDAGEGAAGGRADGKAAEGDGEALLESAFGGRR